jgi:putative endonuclease
MFYTYVLHSELNGRFYIGSTKDLTARLSQHNSGKTPSTRAYRPWKLVYSEPFPSSVAARQREKQIKGWKNRDYLVKSLNITG